MQETKFKSYLEVVTNVAVLLVAIAMLSVLARNFFARPPEVQLQSGLQIGQAITQPPVNLRNSPQTLLIALSTKCMYCAESMDFYKQLVAAQRQAGGGTHLVAIFQDAESTVRRYLQQKQLEIDTVAGIDFKTLNLTATPTVILLDRNGKVLNFWIGRLTKEAERQVVDATLTLKT